MKKKEYVKIDKNFLMEHWNFLNNKIKKLDKLPFDESHPTKELQNLRRSMQDLSFIISKTEII